MRYFHFPGRSPVYGSNGMASTSNPLSSLKEVDIFSIFRKAEEHPIYKIEKRPKLKGKQGMYSVVGMDGHILKRGPDLKTVLQVL